jgi:hypothetical protein
MVGGGYVFFVITKAELQQIQSLKSTKIAGSVMINEPFSPSGENGQQYR